MKKLITAVVLSLSLLPTAQATELTRAEIAYCNAMGNFAASVMKDRQNGVSILKHVEMMETKAVDVKLKSLIEVIVVNAYMKQIESTPRYKSIAIAEYNVSTRKTCIASMEIK
jgi:hypothetical protein